MWVWDHEKNTAVLLIDANYMVLLNDPKLTEFLDQLESNLGTGTGSTVAVQSALKNVVEFAGVALLKLLEIMIEILL